MDVLLLSAGFGTRLKPITNHIPKCLVPICGKPLLEIWLDRCLIKEINSIYVNTHYLGSLVESFIKANYSGYDNKIQILNEVFLLGTGGTIKKNANLFSNDSLIVIHADNLSIFSMEDFINAHFNRPKFTDITMMTFTTEDPKNCGILELDDQKIVKRFHEKVDNPPSKLANAAVYIFEKRVIEYITNIDSEFIDLSNDVLPNFMNKIFTFHNSIYHRDIGTLESYNKSQQDCNKYNFNEK